MRGCPGQSTKKREVDGRLLQVLAGKSNDRRRGIEWWCPIGGIEKAICTMVSLGDRVPLVRRFRGTTKANALLTSGCAYLLPRVRFTVQSHDGMGERGHKRRQQNDGNRQPAG